MRLDPLNLKYNDNLGQEYSSVGQYDLALEQFKKVIEMDPSFASVHGDMSGVYLDTGKYDLWLQELKAAADLSHEPEYAAIAEEVGKVYARSGLQPALREWAEQEKELSKHRYEDPALIGWPMAQMKRVRFHHSDGSLAARGMSDSEKSIPGRLQQHCRRRPGC